MERWRKDKSGRTSVPPELRRVKYQTKPRLSERHAFLIRSHVDHSVSIVAEEAVEGGGGAQAETASSY